MSCFKPNDLVLCVDARGLDGGAAPLPCEGQTYTVSCAETCCVTRVGLAELRPSYELHTVCGRCGAGQLTLANFYAWRFVKVGNTDYAVGAREAVRLARRRRRTADELLRDSFRPKEKV